MRVLVVEDEAAIGELREDGLVVLDVVRLPRVDEDEIPRPVERDDLGLRVAEAGAEDLLGKGDMLYMNAITPKPVSVRWMYDVFGNSVAYAEFGDQCASSLRFESEISILHYEVNQPTALLLPSAEQHPFSYSADEVPDLLVLGLSCFVGGLGRRRQRFNRTAASAVARWMASVARAHSAVSSWPGGHPPAR